MVSARHVVVTGGAGFIGSHLVDALLSEEDVRVTVLDRLSVGGVRANLADHDGDERFRFVLGDVRDADVVGGLLAGADAVVHAAAETHVDRSIVDPDGFLDVNVRGTSVVLEAARAAGCRVLMISTDEVYGAHPEGDDGRFVESDPLRPRSPYAASKAAADLLCGAWRATYGLDVVVLRGTNAYGPRQLERVVPTFAAAALRGEPLPVYGAGRQLREYLHVRDWARAAVTVLSAGEPGGAYNVGSGTEVSSLDLARLIVDAVGADPASIRFVEDRPGHDFRYGVDDARVRALGWAPAVRFDEGLRETLDWYRAHLDAVLAATPPVPR